MNRIYIFKLGFFFILISCTKVKRDSNVKSAEFYFNKAKQYDERSQGNEMAMIYYDSVLMVDPNYAEAWWEKSTWQIKIGNYIKYFEYMDKAVEINPKVHLGWRGVVKMYYLHDFDGALTDLFTYKSLFPQDMELSARGEDINHLIGKAYWQKQEYHKAIYYFDKAINESSFGEEWVDVYNFIDKGICQFELNEYELAEVTFNKAIKLCPNCIEPYFYLAKINIITGKKFQATKNIDKAINLANQGYLRKDSYRDVLGQLYYSDLVLLEEFIRMK